MLAAVLPAGPASRASARKSIKPDTSVILSGATNTRTGCLGHVSMLASPSVYVGVRDFVR